METAARMQTAVPDVLDFSDESEETKRLYGLDHDDTREYGTRCSPARRLVEPRSPVRPALSQRTTLGYP